MTQQDHLEAFDDDEAADADFAGEHQDTAVDEDITGGRDDREAESPRGWSGLDRDAPP